MCTPTLTAALFTTPSSWRPYVPLNRGWKEKMWSVYSMGHRSVTEKSETGLFAETWMDLESVIQSEVRKRRTDVVY